MADIASPIIQQALEAGIFYDPLTGFPLRAHPRHILGAHTLLESVSGGMAYQKGQNICNRRKREENISLCAYLQISADIDKLQFRTSLDDLQKDFQSSQNQLEAFGELTPLGNCSWVDVAEQVFIFHLNQKSRTLGMYNVHGIVHLGFEI